MKFLVLAVCVASSCGSILPGAGYGAGVAPLAYGAAPYAVGPIHVPTLVAHPNGAVTPADEPAVAAARAEHLAAKGAAYAATAPVYGGVYATAPAAAYAGYAAGYASFAGLVAHPNGAVVPVDEPAVQAARAEHLAAKGDAYAAITPVISSGPAYGAAPYAAGYGYAGPIHVPTLVAHPNGAVTPADEPAVAAARAEHLAAKGAAYAAVNPVIAARPAIGAIAYGAAPYAAGYGYAGPIHIPTLVAHPNGAVTPADEPAVVAARAEHLAAKGAAYAAATPVIAAGPTIGAIAYEAAPYAAGYGYAGPIHVPTLVAHPNGAVTPADEPAVAAARAEHLAAKGAAYAATAPVYGGVYATAPAAAYAGYAAGYASFAGLVSHPNGAVVPVDEPAVQAARAEHLAAKGLGW